jgi:hypothetical protein
MESHAVYVSQAEVFVPTPMNYWRLRVAKTAELLPSQLKVIDFEPA